jgi:hypothetical protein
MTTYIKAYSDENLRHPDLFRTSCSKEEVLRGAAALFAHFKVKPIPVYFMEEDGTKDPALAARAPPRRFRRQPVYVGGMNISNAYIQFLGP